MTDSHSRRRVLMLLAASAPPVAKAVPAGAEELSKATALIMVEDRGCPYCARFDAEVRAGYEKSAEGRFAPLVRRLRGAEDVAFLKGVVYSPTFVLLVAGREIGRIVGYQGSELFWMEMSGLMKKAGFDRTNAPKGGS